MADRGEPDNELAYLAGFMDGEGSFMIQEGTNRLGYTQHCAKVSASQVRILPLEVLKKRFGGRISPVLSTYGTEYQWYVSGKNAIEVARQLQPYLLLKKRHAEILMEFGKTVVVARGIRGRRLPEETLAKRYALRAEIRALNGKRKRGDAERLSEGTSLREDAIVCTQANMKLEKQHEEVARLLN